MQYVIFKYNFPPPKDETVATHINEKVYQCKNEGVNKL